MGQHQYHSGTVVSTAPFRTHTVCLSIRRTVWVTEHCEEDISPLFASVVHAVLKAVVEPRVLGLNFRSAPGPSKYPQIGVYGPKLRVFRVQ